MKTADKNSQKSFTLLNFSKKKFGGFTLIEVLVVIAIVGILAGIVLGTLGQARNKAKIARAKLELKQFYNAIFMLEMDTGCWPKSPAEPDCKDPYTIESGAGGNEIWDLNNDAVGLTGDSGTDFPGWAGSYVENFPTDPWGKPYFLDTDYDYAKHMETGSGQWVAVIGSFGSDGDGQNEYDTNDVIYIIAE